jgi:hypothetical protein
LSVNARLELRIPPTVGANVTLTEHEAPATRDPVQVFPLRAKSARFPPARLTPVKVAAEDPVFVTRTVTGLLVVPAFWTAEKLTNDGLTERTAPVLAAEAALSENAIATY